MTGSEKELEDGGKLYAAREYKRYKREKLTETVKPKGKVCINHDNTLRRQPRLHQGKEAGREKAAVNATEYTRLILLEGFGFLLRRPRAQSHITHRTYKTVAPNFD